MLNVEGFREVCKMSGMEPNGFISIYNGEMNRFKMPVRVFNGLLKLMDRKPIINKYDNVIVTFFYDFVLFKDSFVYIESK